LVKRKGGWLEGNGGAGASFQGGAGIKVTGRGRRKKK